ncbi:MAG: bifunctional adenosylcobinamide kinase/adenosylcobinamide-phosphate guanylyltransferase [Lachnospiraceae bacterium]|nr:bifunctional adenosylcobinamide kinase/adenosylcobinamide-phosphate guanylyltransferase [Lachnospiraceae bacterium]
MRLVLGGAAQGKLKYVKEKYGIRDCEVAIDISGFITDKKVLSDDTNGVYIKTFNNFSFWFREELKNSGEPEKLMDSVIEQHPHIIVIGNEVGNGIVPQDDFEREFRERLGRYYISLAGKAESVERVICGLGQVIKETDHDI